MQSSNINNVKIYNLSTSKSIPDWMSDRKKRLLLKKDADLRKRIELIQDFEMPGVSNCIKLSRDGQYVMVSGVYKPRIRCYDVNQLAMKFERCYDSEAVAFEMLSDDYSKFVLLQCDRYIEFHNQAGRYHRLRIPKFGKSMKYNHETCDLYFVGATSEVIRLNLEQGTFLNPFQTNSAYVNTCEVNPIHSLFVCGTEDGHVEAWDPRRRTRVGIIDCALNSVTPITNVQGMPSVTALSFRDDLNLAVGTATGQILLYDIRSKKPYYVKDHLYGLPIKDIEFNKELDLVASMDCKILKFWERNTGKPYTAVQTNSDLNDLCMIPETGMFFLANEDKKVLTYYIPNLGPAPKWCSFLDRIVEELEETNEDTIYDDYKFVTMKDLEDLGLTHLIGTKLLRAYMHGFFMDIRLYQKAKSVSDPFAYEKFKKKKIKEKIEEERADRVKIESQLPKVNRDLAEKILVEEMSYDTKSKKSKKAANNVFRDDRFKALFENPDFQVDEQSETFRLVRPVVSKFDKKKLKANKMKSFTSSKEPANLSAFEELLDEDNDDNREPLSSSQEEESSSSSDDDKELRMEVKKQYKMVRNEAYMKRRQEEANTTRRSLNTQQRFYKLKEGATYKNLYDQDVKKATKQVNVSLADRLKISEGDDYLTEIQDQHLATTSGCALGNRIMSFTLKGDSKKHEHKLEMEKHIKERKKLARPAKGMKKFGKKAKNS